MFMQHATRFALDDALRVDAIAARTGLAAGTFVDTTRGWVPAEALSIGTGVYTIEGGARPVLALDRQVLPAGTSMIRLPGGSFDNCSDLYLLPDQVLVLDQPDGTNQHVAAGSLVGLRGAARIKLARPTECVAPLFAEDEVIWTNSGTRLFCAGITDCAASPRAPQIYSPEALRRLSN